MVAVEIGNIFRATIEETDKITRKEVAEPSALPPKKG
jgi:hypothetical protein